MVAKSEIEGIKPEKLSVNGYEELWFHFKNNLCWVVVFRPRGRKGEMDIVFNGFQPASKKPNHLSLIENKPTENPSRFAIVRRKKAA